MKLRRPFPRRRATSAALIACTALAGASPVGCVGPEMTAVTFLTGSTEGTTQGEDWAIGLLVGVVVAAAVGIATAAMEDDISLQLEEHRIDLERAVARGDGLFVRDLTALLGVGEQGQAIVGAALQAHHGEISAVLADPAPLGPARVRALGLAVKEALVSVPALAGHATDAALERRLRQLGVF